MPNVYITIKEYCFLIIGGLHVSGHTAVLVYLGLTKKPVMLVFFGHSPTYGYLHIVQVCIVYVTPLSKKTNRYYFVYRQVFDVD